VSYGGNEAVAGIEDYAEYLLKDPTIRVTAIICEGIRDLPRLCRIGRQAAEQGKPVLLEPIMKVEVVTPDDYMGDVMGDLNSRRGRVGGMEQRGNAQVIRAQVPLSEMFGYATDLRSRTQGRANYTMQFDSYQQMPGDKQEEIVRRVRGA